MGGHKKVAASGMALAATWLNAAKTFFQGSVQMGPPQSRSLALWGEEEQRSE